MIIHAEQFFDRLYLDRIDEPSEFLKCISNIIESELTNKLMDELGDYQPYFVQLYEARLIKNLQNKDHQVSYKQELEFCKLVQCKDCTMSYPWCHKFRNELGGYGYCPYGYGGVRETDDE